MPFDSAPHTNTVALAVMDHVTARLSDPANWCKVPGGIAGEALCIGLSFINLAGKVNHQNRALLAVWKAVELLFPSRGCVVTFNDHPETTHADVMAVLRRAREILIEGVA